MAWLRREMRIRGQFQPPTITSCVIPQKLGTGAQADPSDMVRLAPGQKTPTRRRTAAPDRSFGSSRDIGLRCVYPTPHYRRLARMSCAGDLGSNRPDATTVSLSFETSSH
jgi:hypothetical protein